MLNWLNTPVESYEFTLDYTVTCIVGLVFIYGYNIVSAILRGMGDSRRPFMFIAIAALINMVIGIVSNSFTAAGSTMVGQNLGAKEYERVPKILRTVGFCTILISTVFTVGIGMFQETVYALFTSDTAVLAVAHILLIPIILNFYGSATRSIAFSLINGSGNTKLNYAVAILDGIISRIGIAALLGFVMNMGCQGFWYGDALAGFIPIVIGMFYFIFGSWKKR